MIRAPRDRTPAPARIDELRGTSVARACAVCGKGSMPGFNPQSTGMNRVRAHRRLLPNLQLTVVSEGGVERKALVCTPCRRTTTKSSR